MSEQTRARLLERLHALEEPSLAQTWPDYVQIGIAEAGQIPDLIALLTDQTLLLDQGEGKEAWVPLHAWRALAQLRAEEAIDPLLSLLHWIDDEDLDDVAEEVPVALGMIGPAAIQPVADYMANASHALWARVAASEALSEIGKRYPEVRQACVELLVRQLQLHADQDRTLNADLIYALVELKAVEAAPDMERAFEADAVNLAMMGDWEDAQIALGLLKKRLTPKPRWNWDGYRIDPEERSASEQQEVREQRQRERKAAKKGKAKRKQAKKARKRK
jgi:hypothetical protein